MPNLEKLAAAYEAADAADIAEKAADATYEVAVKARAVATAAEKLAIWEFQQKLIVDKPRAGGKRKGPNVMDAQKIKQIEAMLRDRETYPTH